MTNPSKLYFYPFVNNILVIGSDGDAAVKEGMKYFFPLATWLSCKKHVEDDVIRKLKDLPIGELKKKKFLLDIFGSDARKEVGLMDAFIPTEFDIMLDSLYPVWKKKTRNKCQRSFEGSIDRVLSIFFNERWFRYEDEDDQIRVRENVG